MDIDEEEKPPLHVFFDIEAMQNTKTHVANLVVAETEEDDRPFHFKGDTSMADFLEWLDTLTAGDTRDIQQTRKPIVGRPNPCTALLHAWSDVKFNPFSCMTIASACNRDLRTKSCGSQHHRFGTASRLATEHQSFECLARMVTLGRFKAPKDSACKKQRIISNSQHELHSGWLWWSHQNRVRISRVL